MQENVNVGIYCRLSHDDERAGESVSIENQRLLLSRYAEQQGWNIYDYYIDDGVSGTTFDRPGFNRLVEDATAHKINVVLCKDLSRLGRDYIEAGKYTSYVFPSMGCRFIALNDDVDTAKNNNEMVVMIKNVVNDLYARDTSVKIKAVKQADFKAGKYIGAYAPFGYQKSAEDKHVLEPDPVTAPIVRRIFDLRCQGRSYRNIALTLNQDGILTPREYYYASIGKENCRNENPYWAGTTVKSILHNEVYIGNMVQNKTGHLSYKMKKLIVKPESEWIRVENTHAPLISRETWDLVQELEKKNYKARTKKNGDPSLFGGLVFCMDCGSPMKHDFESRPRKNGAKSSYESYICTRYCNSGKGACTAHVMNQRVLIQIVLTDIRMKAQWAQNDPENLKEMIRQKRNTASMEQMKSLEGQMKALGKRLGELERLIPNLYEDKVLGRIPESLCVKLMNQYEDERKEKQAQRMELSKKLEECRKEDDGTEEWVSLMQDYSKLEALDRPTLLRLIDRIEIGERKMVNGQDERDIRIYYKFAGLVEM